ncbi:AtpZ/AtpI family protein [Spirosoma fluviale]|uniref:F0F1-ATPase subunit Ca2+/Mg2+ transporter n=1 Tax=Spirosoma fluviale TaxID=1597977 RepID=A0A286GRU8_9BACT|nr:AtpZ/AtpI family protein [Spirosoma fluviale]SOD97896.1 Putative F0F1-ATPase subunit Ca2+/Mg2+ transporter [Spirosoma fluviale]
MENDPDQPERNDTENPVRGNPPIKNVTEKTTSFVQFSGIAFQMLGTIGLGVWAGMKLDAWQNNRRPMWTIILSLTAIGASLYLFIRQLTKR